MLFVDPEMLSKTQRQVLSEAIRIFVYSPSDLHDRIVDASLWAILMTRRPATSRPTQNKQNWETIRDGCAAAHNALAFARFAALDQFWEALAEHRKEAGERRKPRELDEVIDTLAEYAKTASELVEQQPKSEGGRPPVERKQRCVRACIEFVFEPYCPDEIKLTSNDLEGFAGVIWELANPGTNSGMRTALREVFKERAAHKTK